jgi:aryl-alcohol dehydrogenase (NADP+)
LCHAVNDARQSVRAKHVSPSQNRENAIMQYRRLGRTGLKVSPLCLGAMMFGGATDEATAGRIIGRAKAAGVNFIDTADAYNKGESEAVVGRAIRAERDEWVLATKFANKVAPGPNGGGASRKWIMQAVDASLKRLGTDYIDLYYVHKEDHATPLDETVRALGDLVRAGKILHFGLSNHKAWRLAEIAHLCDREGIDRPAASQPLYNALNREVEVEHIPACAHLGIGVVPYSPVARGVLTGKYLPDTPPPNDSRVSRADKRILETEMRPESLRVAQAVKQHAAAKGCTASQWAIAWVAANSAVSAAIAGPRTEEQWEDALGALAVTIGADDEALIDGLVPRGHPSTPGYSDPQYPVEGRKPR